MTTDLPDAAELERLLATGFRNSPKDFSRYIAVLRRLGLEPGAAVLDFGSSWGYGSWQLSQAGYEVWSYDVSQPRLRFAEERLGCRIATRLEEIRAKMDCFFSAHVIEHLPDPNVLWEAALTVLRPRGLVLLFTPNGDRRREGRLGTRKYDLLWGKVHPLVLTPQALVWQAGQRGIRGSVSPTEPLLAGPAADPPVDGDWELTFWGSIPFTNSSRTPDPRDDNLAGEP